MKNRVHAASLLIALAALAAPALAQEVYVGHGITGEDLGLDPALPVDVSVDGACVLEGLIFGEIVGPVPVDVGVRKIEISLNDPASEVGCQGAKAIGVDVPVQLLENATIIAYLTDDGAITAGKFTNDLRPTAEHESRVIVRHLADAPAVDIVARTRGALPTRLFENLSNGDQGKADVAENDYKVFVNPAGKFQPVFGPAELFLAAGTTNIVYAVGTLSSESFTVLVQTIDF
jgi:hypothetical protein